MSKNKKYDQRGVELTWLGGKRPYRETKVKSMMKPNMLGIKAVHFTERL